MEAIYLALAAEAVGGDKSHLPQRSAGYSTGKPGAPAASPKDSSGGGSSGSDKPAGLLHATISRYFDDGPVAQAPSSGAKGPEDSLLPAGEAGARPAEIETEMPPATAAAPAPVMPQTAVSSLPHSTLNQRACEVLVRDASVLMSDPSFRGRLEAGSQDDYGGGGRTGGGLGFFDVVAGGTAAAGGGGAGGGMAPHSWLLKVRLVSADA